MTPCTIILQGNLMVSNASQRQLQMHTQLKWYRGDSIAQINPAAIREVRLAHLLDFACNILPFQHSQLLSV